MFLFCEDFVSAVEMNSASGYTTASIFMRYTRTAKSRPCVCFFACSSDAASSRVPPAHSFHQRFKSLHQDEFFLSLPGFGDPPSFAFAQ
jgi:hypothetical protein